MVMKEDDIPYFVFLCAISIAVLSIRDGPLPKHHVHFIINLMVYASSNLKDQVKPSILTGIDKLISVSGKPKSRTSYERVLTIIVKEQSKVFARITKDDSHSILPNLQDVINYNTGNSFKSVKHSNVSTASTASNAYESKTSLEQIDIKLGEIVSKYAMSLSVYIGTRILLGKMAKTQNPKSILVEINKLITLRHQMQYVINTKTAATIISEASNQSTISKRNATIKKEAKRLNLSTHTLIVEALTH